MIGASSSLRDRGGLSYPSRARSGFSLIEVAVALAVVLILAAVALPNLTGFLDQKRIDATVALLAEVRDGLNSPGVGFRQVLNANAGQLSELTTQIWNNNSGAPPFPLNSCGNTFTNGQVNAWDNQGPYVNFFIPATGLATPIGTANDVMERIPNTNAPGIIRIVIPAVTQVDATQMDATVDLGDGAAGGTIQFTAAVQGRVTMYYVMPINNRC